MIQIVDYKRVNIIYIYNIVKHKSILKNKAMVGSNSFSSKDVQKDLESIGSQRSIKKVTFDKK